ncbi:hypothetical protein [Cupriavidus sp. TMH.W2]
MNQSIPENPDYAVIHDDIVTLPAVAHHTTARSINACSYCQLEQQAMSA